MNLEVNLDSEAINKYVADAILASTIGEHIRDEVDKRVKDIRANPMGSTIWQVVQKEVSKAIYQVVAQEFSEDIKRITREQLTEAILQDIVSRAVTRFVED
jgi:hypothetical protein